MKYLVIDGGTVLGEGTIQHMEDDTAIILMDNGVILHVDTTGQIELMEVKSAVEKTNTETRHVQDALCPLAKTPL